MRAGTLLLGSLITRRWLCAPAAGPHFFRAAEWQYAQPLGCQIRQTTRRWEHTTTAGRSVDCAGPVQNFVKAAFSRQSDSSLKDYAEVVQSGHPVLDRSFPSLRDSLYRQIKHFSDEIGDLDITTRAKLLQVLENGEFTPIGTAEVREADIRVICATHRNLPQMVADKEFREDLYYRLEGEVVHLPPLRERREDIKCLVERFVNQLTIENELPSKLFSPDAIDALIDYDWPGNVRELHNTVETLIEQSDSNLIVADDVVTRLGTSDVAPKPEGKDFRTRIDEFEKSVIIQTLAQTDYNIAAARELGLKRERLSRLAKGLDIDVAALKKNNGS